MPAFMNMPKLLCMLSLLQRYLEFHMILVWISDDLFSFGTHLKISSNINRETFRFKLGKEGS